MTVPQDTHHDKTNSSMVEKWKLEALYQYGNYNGCVHTDKINVGNHHLQPRLCRFEGKNVVRDELNFHGIHSQITSKLAENWSILQTLHDKSLEQLNKS